MYVANNVPSMLRIIVLIWFAIAVVGTALIFPFKEDKEEKMNEDLINKNSINRDRDLDSHESINNLNETETI